MSTAPQFSTVFSTITGTPTSGTSISTILVPLTTIQLSSSGDPIVATITGQSGVSSPSGPVPTPTISVASSPSGIVPPPTITVDPFNPQNKANGTNVGNTVASVVAVIAVIAVIALGARRVIKYQHKRRILRSQNILAVLTDELSSPMRLDRCIDDDRSALSRGAQQGSVERAPSRLRGWLNSVMARNQPSRKTPILPVHASDQDFGNEKLSRGMTTERNMPKRTNVSVERKRRLRDQAEEAASRIRDLEEALASSNNNVNEREQEIGRLHGEMQWLAQQQGSSWALGLTDDAPPSYSDGRRTSQ